MKTNKFNMSKLLQSEITEVNSIDDTIIKSQDIANVATDSTFAEQYGTTRACDLNSTSEKPLITNNIFNLKFGIGQFCDGDPFNLENLVDAYITAFQTNSRICECCIAISSDC